MADGLNTPESVHPQADAGDERPAILSLTELRDRYASRQKRVTVPALGADIIVRKLPAKIIQDGDLGEQSPMMLALKEGVVEPVIDDEMIAALTFEEANGIYEAVEAWNPGVLSSNESEVADKRKEFPE